MLFPGFSGKRDAAPKRESPAPRKRPATAVEGPAAGPQPSAHHLRVAEPVWVACLDPWTWLSLLPGLVAPVASVPSLVPLGVPAFGFTPAEYPVCGDAAAPGRLAAPGAAFE